MIRDLLDRQHREPAVSKGEERSRAVLALGTLPSGVAAGSPSSVTVTITDDDTTGRTLMERCASYLPANAVSVAEVTGWRGPGGALVALWACDGRASGDTDRGADGGAAAAGLQGALRGPGASGTEIGS